jgi:hypothetical protein
MLLFALTMALTAAQQTQHDHTEWTIYQRLHMSEEAIAELWRPSAKVLADYREAKKCYVRFHLYRTSGCGAELRR